MPAGFDFEDGDEIGRINQGFVFRTLSGVEVTLVGPFTQRVDPLLHWLTDLEGNETAEPIRHQGKDSRVPEGYPALQPHPCGMAAFSLIYFCVYPRIVQAPA